MYAIRPIPVLLALALVGCQATGPRLPGLSPGNPLVLETRITVPGEAARVHLQGERRGGFAAIDRFEPFCELEFARLAPPGGRTIGPARFRITAAARRLDGDEVTGGIPDFGGLFGGVGDEPDWVFVTVLELDSRQHPDVIRLTCKRLAPATEGAYPDARAIRDALGPGWRLGSAAPPGEQ